MKPTITMKTTRSRGRMDPVKVAILGIVASLTFSHRVEAQPIGGLPTPASAPNRQDLLKIREPDAIQVKQNAALDREVLSGASDSDAVNAAVKRLREKGEDGAIYVRTESGIGVVGVATVSSKPAKGVTNPNRIAMSARLARARALLQAKGEIAKLLASTRDEGKNELVKQQKLIDDQGKGAKVAAPEVLSAFIRGAVFYDCAEDVATSLVNVAVVTTPRTQGDIRFDSIELLTASNLQAAKNLVLAQVKAGVAPPSGGTVLTILGTDPRIAWIAWDTEYVDSKSDPRVAAQIREDAIDGSRIAAQKALLALMRGEKIEVEKEMATEIAEFVRAANEQLGGGGKESFEQSRQELVKTVTQSETVRSIVEGKVMHGVETLGPLKSEDGRFVSTLMFYAPESSPAVATAMTSVAQREIPLGNPDRRAKAYPVAPDGTFQLGPDGTLKPMSAGAGIVSPKKDL